MNVYVLKEYVRVRNMYYKYCHSRSRGGLRGSDRDNRLGSRGRGRAGLRFQTLLVEDPAQDAQREKEYARGRCVMFPHGGVDDYRSNLADDAEY